MKNAPEKYHLFLYYLNNGIQQRTHITSSDEIAAILKEVPKVVERAEVMFVDDLSAKYDFRMTVGPTVIQPHELQYPDTTK